MDPLRDKRGNARKAKMVRARLVLKAQALDCRTRDVSAGGAYLLTADDLRMELSLDHGGGPGESPAGPVRLVRCDMLPGGGIGIAVQAIPPGEAART